MIEKESRVLKAMKLCLCQIEYTIKSDFAGNKHNAFLQLYVQEIQNSLSKYINREINNKF